MHALQRGELLLLHSLAGLRRVFGEPGRAWREPALGHDVLSLLSRFGFLQAEIRARVLGNHQPRVIWPVVCDALAIQETAVTSSSEEHAALCGLE